MKTEIKYKDKSFQVQLLNDTEHISKWWKAGKFYEADMLEYIETNYEKEGIFIDIGTCIGNHALFFAGVMDAKKVFCFEPVSELNEFAGNVLNEYIEKGIVKLYDNAISDYNGKAKFEQCDLTKNAGISKVSENGFYEVPVKKLDTIITRNRVDKVDVIKIDVEDYNLQVLDGAAKTINKYKPDIFIESHYNFIETSEKLAEFGYIYSGKQFCKTPTFLFTYKQ